MEPTPLGKGGFGTVFLGKGEDGREVVIKRLDPLRGLPIERELRVTDGLVGKNLAHVIPILDVGTDAAGDAFIVMARAAESLEAFIQRHGALPEAEAIGVLEQIASGLQEIETIVHRDLKPQNVLLHDGCWKIADFGLVRLSDASTSTNTVKGAFTPPFAAPEQWRGERATHATDIYALGCIGYSLLTTKPPFAGSIDELRSWHLSQPPPPLPVSLGLQQLILRCLRKSPESRPLVAEVQRDLRRVAEPTPAPLGGLQQVASEIAAAQASEDAAQAVVRREAEERKHAADAGMEAARALLHEFFARLKAAAPIARLGADGRSIRLGRATLAFKESFPLLNPDAFPRSGFSAVAGIYLELRQESASYPGRSSNLWLANLDSHGLRWWEAAYMTTSTSSPSRRPDEPFGIRSSTELEVADRAAGAAGDIYQYGMTPALIEGDGAEAFIQRWANRLAAAAKGDLAFPRYLPD